MCTVCKHNQIKDIDRTLLTGATLTSLSPKYGFSTSALHCHQEHLQKKMAAALERFHDGLRQGLFCKLNSVIEMVLGVVWGARAGEDFKLFLQASREVTRIISLMIKMDVHLGPEMIYCLMSSHQWDLQDSLLPNAFQTPTPDWTSAECLGQSDSGASPQAGNRELATDHCPKNQREINAKLARKTLPAKQSHEANQ